jgi:type IV secretory pathway VirB10-like protein
MFTTVLGRTPHCRFWERRCGRRVRYSKQGDNNAFSLPSYLLGVGTVVGALAFGFGGGVLLTKTAMKDTPVAETRVERVKRADSPSAAPRPVETVDTKAMPAPPPPAEAAPPVQASGESPKAESTQPIAEVPKQSIARIDRAPFTAASGSVFSAEAAWPRVPRLAGRICGSLFARRG